MESKEVQKSIFCFSLVVILSLVPLSRLNANEVERELIQMEYLYELARASSSFPKLAKIPNADVLWSEISYTDVREDARFNVISREMDFVESCIGESQNQPFEFFREDVNQSDSFETFAESRKADSKIREYMETKDEEILRKANVPFESPSDQTLDKDYPGIDIEVGTEIFRYIYKEPSFMKDEGLLFGVNAAITSRLFSKEDHNSVSKESVLSRSFSKVELSASFGEVDYTSQSTGSADGIGYLILEFRGLLGSDYQATDSVLISPYFGFGYRYLHDDSGGLTTTTGQFGYDRESNYYYSPTGFVLNVDLGGGWSLGTVHEYDIFWYGKQFSYLGDAIAGLDTVENAQHDGWGYRGTIRLQHKGDEVDLLIEPFYRHWSIKDSDVSPVTYSGVTVGYGLEPKNETSEFGIQASLKF